MNPVDYSSVIMSLSVAAYGAYRYVQREKDHRALLHSINNPGFGSPSSTVETNKPAAWRLIAVALGEVLLVAHLIWRVDTTPDVWGGMRLTSVVVTIYLMMALPGVLGLLKRALWRLMTLCFIEVVLVAAIVWLMYVRSKIIYAGELTYVIAFSFVVLFLVLLPMVVRDFKSYRNI